MSKLPSVLLFLGPEDGLRSEELGSLRLHIRKESGGPAEEHRIYLPDGTVGDAVDLLQNGSLFASHRLVILAGAEQIRKKSDVDTIRAYCDSPPQGATLVLVSDALRLDSKLEKAVPSQARKVFWELFDNQKRGWLAGHFRKRNVGITDDALELFLDLVENNTQELRVEADKLCIYVSTQHRGESGGEWPTADVDDVETFVYHSREETVFSLYKRVVEDDFAAALEIVEKLASSGDGGPVALVGGLVFQVRKLVSLRSLLDNGYSFAEACTRLAIRGKRIQADYRAAADRFVLAELQRQLRTLVAYDTVFRELGSGMERTLLDLLVYQLMFRSTTLRIEEEADGRLVG